MLVINATYFKKICTDVFGKDRVTFEEHVNSPYQQINCYVDQQPVAKFCINYYELFIGFSSVLDWKLNTVLGTMPYIQVSIYIIF